MNTSNTKGLMINKKYPTIFACRAAKKWQLNARNTCCTIGHFYGDVELYYQLDKTQHLYILLFHHQKPLKQLLLNLLTYEMVASSLQ